MTPIEQLRNFVSFRSAAVSSCIIPLDDNKAGDFLQAAIDFSDAEEVLKRLEELEAAVEKTLLDKCPCGIDLCCWCPLCDLYRAGKPLDEHCPDCAPCHADPLGELVVNL